MNVAATTGSLPGAEGWTYLGIAFNLSCEMQTSADGERIVLHRGLPVFRMARGDIEAEDVFIAQALEGGWAKPIELSRGLERPLRSIHRARRQYVDGGVGGVIRKKRGPKGPRLGAARESTIRRMHEQGATLVQMAAHVKVSRGTVRNALERMGLRASGDAARQAEMSMANEVTSAPSTPADAVSSEAEPVVSQPDASAPEAAPEAGPAAATMPEDMAVTRPRGPLPTTLDTDPSDRVIDRMLAARGELYDAVPLFAPGENLAYAGALLAMPMIVASGAIEEAEATFGHIGPAFYGLRTIVVTFLLLALLRVKRPENLKEYSPPTLGRILGLDRAPEVKTVRRKLARMADEGLAERFLERLAKRRITNHSEAMGFLYVDGHVRVYHGQVDIPKTHVARLRLSLPATQDVWVNDANGQPVMLVTQEAHPQLVGALRPILTGLRAELGERRVTVVFDRGGFSPKLFRWMDDNGFDVLTYRKGAATRVPDDAFTTHVVATPRGPVTYELHDMLVAITGGFEMRQVTRRQGDHQTQILTTRRDLPVTTVAVRMFARWQQENFFKYMREQYAIDALVEHGVDLADPERLVPNPARLALDKALRTARAEVVALEARYGAAALDNEERSRPTMRGFKIAHGAALGIPLRQARETVARLQAERKALPARVPVGRAKGEALRLPWLRKRLSDGMKMLAYQLETDLVRAVAPGYKRSLDEGRRLIAAALRSAGDIELTHDEIRVTLMPQSSPQRTRAIAKLCELLTATDTCFPGTALRLRYVIRDM